MASSSLFNSPPTKNILPTPLIITPWDLKTNHQSLYVQFESVEIHVESEEDSNTGNTDSHLSTACPITSALMNKQNHFPSLKTDNSGKKNIMQYNTIVNYMKSRKYGAKVVFLTDYTDAIQTFADILWEIDTIYQKLI